MGKMAVGWKTVRTLGAILCVGRMFPTVIRNIRQPVFSIRNCYLCVCLVKSVMQKQKKDAERKS